MKKSLIFALAGIMMSSPIIASNLPIKCPTCGKMMVPGTWHKCPKNG